MKLLFQLLLGVLAVALALAAPTRPLQVALADSTKSEPPTSHANKHVEIPKFKLPYVVKAPIAYAGKNHKSSMPCWMKKWHTPLSWFRTSTAHITREKNRHGFHFHKAGSAQLSCFCAGVSVCCHTSAGLDCNSGYCGI